MKGLFILLLLTGLAYFGYTYYQNSKLSSSPVSTKISIPDNLVITQASNKLGDIASVLGASIQNVLTDGKDILNNATAGQSDPIINKAVENIQNELKDLPQETVEKVKYEFCKDIVTSYEEKKP
ncbi:MAG: hypothetical protein UX62_C0029G0005 [Microgenomates group bacterium GW2011_GWA2_46_7]|nr:MAG: hypothetical protein UX62_C0029G0005 [Microgenomates group bacterium GW2011_GWA2_46_7]